MKKIVILCLVLLGCNEIRECDLDPNVGYATVVFYEYEDPDETKLVQFDYFYATKYPAVRYAMDTTAIGFGLPIDPEASSLTYVMVTDSTDYSLKLDYRTYELRLYSIDCGPSFGYADLVVDSIQTNFDSVAVIGSTINKDVPINVEVYF